LKDREDEDDKVLRRVWKAVEAEAREVRMAEVKRRNKKKKK